MYDEAIEDYRVKEGAGRRRAALAYALLNNLLSRSIGRTMTIENVWLAQDLLTAVREGMHDARWYGMARGKLAVADALTAIKEAADSEYYKLASDESEAVLRWSTEADSFEGFVAKAKDVYQTAIKENPDDSA